MRSKEFLAEKNAAKNKTEKYLNLLSDEELDDIINLVNKKLNEQRFGGKSLYDKPAAVPTTKSVPKQQPKNVKQPNIKPKKQDDLVSVVSNLSEKDKELLKQVLQGEKKQRQTKSKKTDKSGQDRSTGTSPASKPKEPKKSSGMLGKIVLGVLLGVGGLTLVPDLPKQYSDLMDVDTGMYAQDVLKIMNKKPDEKHNYGYDQSEQEWIYKDVNGTEDGIIHFAGGKVMYVMVGNKTLESDSRALEKFREKSAFNRVSFGQYRVKIGMTYSEVVTILGSPQDEVTNINTKYGNSTTYRWKTDSGLFDNLYVEFDNGRVESVFR